jgi:hypothetical protein
MRIDDHGMKLAADMTFEKSSIVKCSLHSRDATL